MKRPVEVLRGAGPAVRDRAVEVANQPARTILLGTVLLASALSAVTCYVLTQYFSLDVLSYLVAIPEDCWLDWGVNVGRHCFSDFSVPVGYALRANPWDPYPIYGLPDFTAAHNNYVAAGMLPQTVFGLLGKGLGVPRLGLFAYLLALTVCVLTPAAWAARGARGLERVVVFVACGMVAIPAWTVIDRGNSLGFLVPVALVFLVALCRGRWGLVTVMVILAALVKPQFALLAIVLFAARQWRLGGIAVGGVAVTNLAAFLLWPRDFPHTIAQAIHNTLGYGWFQQLVGLRNVSFARALLWLPDAVKSSQTGGTIPDGFLAAPRSLIGYVIVLVVVACVVMLGRRIPPVMVGIVLLATAALFPALVADYYLVFALPVAAVIARDPDGPPGTGIFDRPAAVGGRRPVVALTVSVATALSIAQIAISTQPIKEPILGQMGAVGIVGYRTLALTTVGLTPLFWLIACTAIIVSYARRPASTGETTVKQAGGEAESGAPLRASEAPA
ncbi:glycosyltransferase family 87 protein [Mycobacterium bohemicum]|uniref:glycosyltransferase family 87 protein n=1 Tax=Mycobacterium bohemicum TaxID=56425 RepID=UPI00111C90AA|nr:glycosyltransferase family 87 protein [Mycobacterium bohemicum]MCV6969485.1 DUF2029 domain-containing protein [Mycobacterium bohemicum]